VHSNKFKKKWKKPKAHGYEAQTHATWWIRISRMPQRRWIDPDTLKPRSNGWECRALDRVWTDPIQRLYKRITDRFAHFLSFFLFLLSVLSSSPMQTLTLVHPDLPRTCSNMLQSVHLVVLNTNPPLEITCNR